MEDRLKGEAGDAGRAALPAGAGDGAREAGYVVAAAALIALVTAAWWALALWPAGRATAAAPAWLERLRLVCFGVHADGLPDTAGWLALVGEPLGMLGVLLVGWRAGVRAVARRIRTQAGARFGFRVAMLLLGAGALTAGWRIRSALAESRVGPWTTPPAGAAVRLDRAPPPLALVDQHGRTRTLASFRGRPLLLTFAYAHCETVCPLTVRAVTDAAARARRERPRAPTPAVAIVTVDPWRDTPARLPALVREWGLGPEAVVLGGTVPQVEAVLDAWRVARARDPATGELTHSALVYVLDERGRIAWAAPGEAGTLVALLRRVTEDTENGTEAQR